MAPREQDPFDRLETLARNTDNLCPDNDFTAAVMANLNKTSAESILEKAQRETAELAPTDDFVASVMQSVGQLHSVGQGSRVRPSNDTEWNARIVRSSRFALMVAAAAAVFCLWLSSQAETSFDSAILGDVAALEVDE